MNAVPKNAGAWDTIVVVRIVRISFTSDCYFSFEPSPSPFQIILEQIGAQPTTLKPFGDFPGHTTPRKGIKH